MTPRFAVLSGCRRRPVRCPVRESCEIHGPAALSGSPTRGSLFPTCSGTVAQIRRGQVRTRARARRTSSLARRSQAISSAEQRTLTIDSIHPLPARSSGVFSYHFLSRRLRGPSHRRTPVAWVPGSSLTRRRVPSHQARGHSPWGESAPLLGFLHAPAQDLAEPHGALTSLFILPHPASASPLAHIEMGGFCEADSHVPAFDRSRWDTGALSAGRNGRACGRSGFR